MTPTALAASVIKTWTRVYTARLAPDVRDARRAEIDSDLWEHAHAASEVPADRRAVAGQMLARCLLGMGSDLSWRSQMAAGRARPARKEAPMNERVRQDWWIPGPIAMVALGAFVTLTLIVGDGFESPWERTEAGWDPSALKRAGWVAMIGLLFVAFPAVALALRRRHPGWTVVLLTPWVFVSMPLLGWDSIGWHTLIPVIGIATLIGAFVNLARSSVEGGPVLSSSDIRGVEG
jgi:hypothetical protein